MSLHKKIWFQGSSLKWFFWPFSVLYSFIVFVRKKAYEKGFLKVYVSKVPIIVIGNIMVGGNGKTPVVIALAEYLTEKGYKVGVVSRGYKAQPPKLPYEVTPSSKCEEGGDEPLLIKLKTKATVVIDPDRVRAVKSLEDKVDVILSDDGLQHYSMGRDIEIVVIDGVRRFGNGGMLPMGPLREPISRLKTVDLLINNGCSEDGEYDMRLQPGTCQRLDGNNEKLPLGKVIALAGIGAPERFKKTLEEVGYTVQEMLPVPDHGNVPKDIIINKSVEYPLVMTEKDAVKYRDIKSEKVWSLGITASISKEFYIKFDTLLAKALNKKKEKNEL